MGMFLLVVLNLFLIFITYGAWLLVLIVWFLLKGISGNKK